MSRTSVLGIGALCASLLLGGGSAAFAQSTSSAMAPVASASARTVVAQEGSAADRRSDRNLRYARQEVNRLIGQLQRDEHEYGGHRVRALQELTEARNELDAALRYDAQHDRDRDVR